MYEKMKADMIALGHDPEEAKKLGMMYAQGYTSQGLVLVEDRCMLPGPPSPTADPRLLRWTFLAPREILHVLDPHPSVGYVMSGSNMVERRGEGMVRVVTRHLRPPRGRRHLSG